MACRSHGSLPSRTRRAPSWPGTPFRQPNPSAAVGPDPPSGRSSRSASLSRARRPGGVRRAASSSSAARTVSTCSVSPTAPSVRIACARTRGSSCAASRAAPSPAPPTSWRVATLRHISAGRHSSSSRPATTAPVAVSAQTWRSPRRTPGAHPVVLPDGGVEGPVAGVEGMPGEVAQRVEVLAPVGAAQQVDADRDRRVPVPRCPASSRTSSATGASRSWGRGRPATTSSCRTGTTGRYGARMDDGLLSRARAWAEDDPDGATRAELEAIIAAVEGGADDDDLADRFAGTLEFGTAGLRGALGAGPNRMNRVVVLARGGRPGGVPPRHRLPRRQPRRDRVRRPLQLRRLRDRHRRGDDRARGSGRCCCRGRCPRRCWPMRSASSAASPG